MRFLHLADLHIGKRLNEFNLIEDQRHILQQIVEIAHDQQVDGILIAGDVYDKSQPSAEAVQLLDDFLTNLAQGGFTVFMISGNHDSPERLSFGSRLFQQTGLHVARSFSGTLEKITREDEHGPLNIYLLPFVRPPQVRQYFEGNIATYHDAVQAILASANINWEERNILIAHQFVISGGIEPERSDSEIISVGSLDSVDASLFTGFDYTALGHLHRSQTIGGATIRYAGSPLKYSFSEARHEKSVTIVDLGPKGEVAIEEHPLIPKLDLREIKGPLAELLEIGKEAEFATDYLRITLTDEDEIYDALGQLRPIYPNLMLLDFENRRTFQTGERQTAATQDLTKQSPLDLFASFYELQNNTELTEEQIEILEDIFTEAGGEKV